MESCNHNQGTFCSPSDDGYGLQVNCIACGVLLFNLCDVEMDIVEAMADSRGY